MPTRWAVIVAGGVGARMKGNVPKQFRLLNGMPVWVWAAGPFAAEGFRLVVVTHPDHQDRITKAGARFFPTEKIYWAPAGKERFFSVKSGIERLAETAKEDDIVAVHDAARPFVDRPLIRRGLQQVMKTGAAVPAVPPYDSMRIHQLQEWKPFPRAHLRMVQTPQLFRYGRLYAAYQQPYQPHFTDDAAVVEAAMYPVSLYEGSRLNFKITTEQDWALARAWAAYESRPEG